jgi:uncharacterized protein YaeQ
MKYWNKGKELRIRCWIKVTLPKDRIVLGPGTTFAGWTRRNSFDDLKRELQHHPSKSRFYMMILKKEVWFENSYDALEFKLRWGVR